MSLWVIIWVFLFIRLIGLLVMNVLMILVILVGSNDACCLVIVCMVFVFRMILFLGLVVCVS